MKHISFHLNGFSLINLVVVVVVYIAAERSGFSANERTWHIFHDINIALILTSSQPVNTNTSPPDAEASEK